MLTAQVWLDLDERLVSMNPDAPDQPRDAGGADMVVTLTGEGFGPQAYAVEVKPRPLRPADVPTGARDRAVLPLLIGAAASPATLRRAREAQVSVLVAPVDEHARTTGVLFFPGGSMTFEPPEGRSARPRGRVPWATYAAAVRLLDGPVSSQTALAAEIGVSPARVSQICRTLGPHVLRPASGGLVAADSLAAWLAARYPGAAEMSRTYLSAEPVATRSARRLVRWLGSRGVATAVSGEFAADAIAPWASPSRLLVYADRLADLTDAGLTPAPVSVANVVVAAPTDPYVAQALARVGEDEEPVLLDPWRVWLDLLRDQRTDAAATLSQHLVARTA